MGVREPQRAVQLYRGQIPSPGSPMVAWREDTVRFWAATARGAKTEAAAVEAGVSGPVAFRWFRHAGGVNPCLPPTVSGRYLSFAEREDIAMLRTQICVRRRVPGALSGGARHRLERSGSHRCLRLAVVTTAAGRRGFVDQCGARCGAGVGESSGGGGSGFLRVLGDGWCQYG